jgi:hypothetical protein
MQMPYLENGQERTVTHGISSGLPRSATPRLSKSATIKIVHDLKRSNSVWFPMVVDRLNLNMQVHAQIDINISYVRGNLAA